MIDPLELHSERFSETGNQAARGIRNQLGRPSLSQLVILIRESVQNSWDARVSDQVPVTYGIRSWLATEDQRTALAEIVFRERPAKGLDLSTVLDDQNLRLMTVYDRGTNGLCGPTRANIEPPPGQDNNFNNLLRNIGAAQQAQFSGGTYGYGKAALFQTSQVNTILAFTRVGTEHGLEARLMAASLGEQFYLNRVPHTGRHWWGVKESHLPDEITDPVLDEGAYAIADRLGMKPFIDDETGTSLTIVQPSFESQHPPDAISNALLWNFWPKMIAQDGTSTIQFELEWDGENIDLPEPQDVQALRPFIASLEAVRECERDENSSPIPPTLTREVTWRRTTRLGYLAMTPARDVEVPSDEDDLELGTIPVDSPLRHVALMRRAELVVRYMAGDEHELEGMHYGAVFKSDPGVDASFAQSEPPTHDDWQPRSLPAGNPKSHVNVAIREIKHELRQYAHPSKSTVSRGSAGPSLGLLSESLAGLLPGEEDQAIGGSGVGGGSPGSGGGGGGGCQRARLRFTGEPVLVAMNGGSHLKVEFEVEFSGDQDSVEVEAVSTATVDDSNGRRESEPPVGERVPVLKGWIDPEGTALGPVQPLPISSSESGPWTAIVEMPDSSATRLDLRIR